MFAPGSKCRTSILCGEASILSLKASKIRVITVRSIPKGAIWDITLIVCKKVRWLLMFANHVCSVKGAWSPFEGQAPTGRLGRGEYAGRVLLRNGTSVAASFLRNILYIYIYCRYIYIYVCMHEYMIIINYIYCMYIKYAIYQLLRI